MRVFDSSCMNIAYSSHHFFGQELVPQIERAGRRRIAAATKYEQRDALEYLYVSGGQGEIEINGERQRIQRGSCLVLTNYQIHRFLPAEDAPLELNYCCLKDGTVYVLWCCPYYQPPDFKTSSEKTSKVQQFEPEEIDNVERIWRDLYQCQFSTDYFAKEQQLYLFMEFVGWFHRLCYRDCGAE